MRKMRVTGVVTQGASRAGSAEYLKTFKVAYSVNGRKFQFIQDAEGTGDKVRTLKRHWGYTLWGPSKGSRWSEGMLNDEPCGRLSVASWIPQIGNPTLCPCSVVMSDISYFIEENSETQKVQ